MRIDSITVRNYRVIRDLRVELDEKLTLLGGPNETGKSTLIEAAHRALFLRAKTTGAATKRMESTRHFGIPEVEVGFTARGRRYQLSKTFSGTNGIANLTEIGGPTWRGDEAESKLAELLGVEATGGGRGAGERSALQWAHLWVWQGQSGDDPTDHATDQKDSLLARLQEQGGGVAMQSALDAAVEKSVANQQAELFNQNGRPKKDSDLGRALHQFESAKIELQTAQATLCKLEQAVADSHEADRTIADCHANLIRLQSDIEKLEQQLAHVASLRSDEQKQEAAAETAANNHESLHQADKKIRKMRDEVHTRTEALAPLNAETERLRSQVSNATEVARQAETDYQAAIAAARHTRLHQELASAWVTLFERTAQRDLLLGKQKQVNDVRDRLAGREAEVAKIPAITPDKLKELQDLNTEWSSADAALRAMAAGIDVVASDLGVQVEDRTLGVGESCILTEDTDITIGSAIRLRIKPGGGTSLQEARQSVQKAHRALQDELDALGLSSTAAAAEASATRQQLKADIKADKAQLAGLGADSIDKDVTAAKNAVLTAEADVQQRATLVSEFIPPTNAADAQSLKSQSAKQQRDADAKESSCQTARDVAVTVRQEAIDALADHRQALRNEEESVTGLEAQLRLLMETHGDDEVRSHRLTELLTNKTNAVNLLAATRDALAALQPEQLESDHARLERAIDQCRSNKNAADTKRAVARNILQSDGSADPQAALAVAAAKANSAKEHLESVQKNAEAVQLLHQLFLDEQRALSEQFTRPFAEKITGYLQCLFGANVKANVRFEDKFCGFDIVRPEQGTGALAFGSLSAGAKEQMGAAVRLAMAEVLAENHDGCLPVVFDDAFANSDPDRVATLQRMLDRAAQQGLQIIVLSCTPSDYAALGAKTIPFRAEPASRTHPADELSNAIPPPENLTPDADEGVSPSIDITDSDRDAMLSAVQAAGGSKGNVSLREHLGWDEATYNAVKNELVTAGQLILGRGRGGSVSLPNAD